jgi:hypothetical protein
MMTPVDETLLRKAIAEAEKGGPLANLSGLNQKVADIYNKIPKSDPKYENINGPMAGSRIKAFNIDIKTKAGKKGRAPGSLPPGFGGGRPAGPRIGRGAKLAAHPQFKEWVATMQHNAGPENEALVEKVQKGSIKAMIRLHCKDCMGYQNAEIPRCTAVGCPFYLIRAGANKVQVEVPSESEG